MLGPVDDMWFRWITDVGRTGPDQGQGGNYLFLPPGFAGEVPDGYFTFSSPTYGAFILARGFTVNGDPGPAVESIHATARIYPLSEAQNRPETPILDGSGLAFNTVHANDFSFYEEVDELVQEEPVEALDPERAGQLAAIGIVKGRPFAPDDRMRAILERAAAIGAGIARTVAYAPRDPYAVLYGTWKNAFVGGSYEFLRNGARLLDARTQFHYLATVITPAMAHAQVGAGSAYAYTVHDANGDLLDGESGADDLYGGEGSDWLLGRQGADELFGGGHKDTLDIATDDDASDDDVHGGTEDDLIFSDDGAATPDDVRGDGGTDTCLVDGVDLVLSCEL